MKLKEINPKFSFLNENPTTLPNKKNNSSINASSLNISQEDAIQSFDNIQFAKMPQPSTSKENSPQTPLSPNDSKIQKQKLSPTLSIDLKPRKKQTNSKRKNSV